MESQQHLFIYIYNLYSQILLFFINYYQIWFNTANPTHVLESKPKNILTETDQYIQQNTDRFLRSFTQNTNLLSSNIDPIFYVKSVFIDTIQDEINNIEPSWKQRILIESTPRGNVIMYYDAYKLGFTYYSDTNGIPYSLLNAVAMKYVLTFYCRDFFMDDQVTPENTPSPLIEIHYTIPKIGQTNNDSSKNPLKNAPFAKFKNYNHNHNTRSSDNMQKVINKNKLEREYNCNKFFSLGKITNFKLIQPIIKTHFALNGFKSLILDNLSEETVLQKQVMNYKDYKNTIMITPKQ